MDNSHSAAREARRLLADRVRNTWTWPPPPTPTSASPLPITPSTEFRPRFYASSASELEETPPSAPPDPYIFDSPDSVGGVVGAREDARRRRRRAKFHEEVEWNEGLATWAARRDAWTGVAQARAHRRRQREEQQQRGQRGPRQSGAGSDSDREKKDGGGDISDGLDGLRLTGDGDSGSTLPSSIGDGVDSGSEAEYEGLVPLAPPILPPSHPIRASITPKAYPEIFEKVVMGARTPAVPINLADLTASLVAGWKTQGEWPPKARPMDPLVGRRRNRAGRLSVGRGEGEFLASHPHVKRGVESMKKVFRMSESHSSDKGVADG